jgi:hypothetical protein
MTYEFNYLVVGFGIRHPGDGGIGGTGEKRHPKKRSCPQITQISAD